MPNKRASSKKGRKNNQLYTLAAAVLVVLGIGIFAVYWNQNQGSGTNSAQGAVPKGTLDPEAGRNALMKTMIKEARHFKGDPDAPVTILEFSDFQ